MTPSSSLVKSIDAGNSVYSRGNDATNISSSLPFIAMFFIEFSGHLGILPPEHLASDEAEA